jgi:hypothetical protein
LRQRSFLRECASNWQRGAWRRLILAGGNPLVDDVNSSKGRSPKSRTPKAGHQKQDTKRSTTVSIFGNIISAIFKSARPAGASAAPPSAQPGATATATMAQVDVADVMTKLAGQNPEKLDWKRSIVDLMKLLNLDSSLTARKQLAQELRYTGDMNDSASMNIWLHKQVMQKLAENGGKVPADLMAR